MQDERAEDNSGAGVEGKQTGFEKWELALSVLKEATLDGYLIHRRTGHNLPASEGAFQLAVRRAKIDDLHFHDLRHTFSTMVRAFTDMFTVRDLMGHKKVDTTDIYVTAPLEDMRTAVEAMTNRGKGARVQNRVKFSPGFHRAGGSCAEMAKSLSKSSTLPHPPHFHETFVTLAHTHGVSN